LIGHALLALGKNVAGLLLLLQYPLAVGGAILTSCELLGAAVCLEKRGSACAHIPEIEKWLRFRALEDGQFDRARRLKGFADIDWWKTTLPEGVVHETFVQAHEQLDTLFIDALTLLSQPFPAVRAV